VPQRLAARPRHSKTLAGTVVREYKESGYALTTEVLLVSDAGVETIGAFPE
jgi:hypothetical protein